MTKINEVKKDLEIVEMDELEGLTISKNNSDEKITIYDRMLIEDAIERNFEKKYKKLLYLVMMYNEDESSSDYESIILQIDNFKNYLINKYFKLIGPYKLNQYLEMILTLESQININKYKGR